MDASRRESRPFWRKLLLLLLIVSFERLPGEKVSTTPSCGTSQLDGDHALSCSNRENTRSSSRSTVDKRMAYANSTISRIKRRALPSAPLEEWQAVSHLLANRRILASQIQLSTQQAFLLPALERLMKDRWQRALVAFRWPMEI